MIVQLILLAFTALLLPGYLLFALVARRETSVLRWLLKLLYTGALVVYVFLAARWAWLSIYLRYLWLGLYVAAAVLSYTRLRGAPFVVADEGRRRLGAVSYAFTLLIAFLFLGLAVRARSHADQPVRLELPFQDGRYYVAHAGWDMGLGYREGSLSRRHGVSFVQLNSFGARARGLFPADLRAYVIFGRTVHSPCDGTVTAAVDGIPDRRPLEVDARYPAGNHVVISCQNVDLLLAHLQSGSVAVEAGQRVESGQVLGRVGNSGETQEPRLYIHAVDGGTASVFEGEPVPILFDLRYPARNRVFVGD